jgi:hypothetical protein
VIDSVLLGPRDDRERATVERTIIDRTMTVRAVQVGGGSEVSGVGRWSEIPDGPRHRGGHATTTPAHERAGVGVREAGSGAPA